MATCRSVPRSPMAIDAAAMTAGPARKRTAIETAAADLPHAMTLGCSAINNPGQETVDSVSSGADQGRRVWAPVRARGINCGAMRCRATGRQEHKGRGHPPRLNMAIPSPASERMEMDLATIAGMETCHL
uniref:Uncharacterized protein n=1 Tax=Oryza brachyantha TaxID=4533 RepID=J3L2A5_ORYBR